MIVLNDIAVIQCDKTGVFFAQPLSGSGDRLLSADTNGNIIIVSSSPSVSTLSVSSTVSFPVQTSADRWGNVFRDTNGNIISGFYHVAVNGSNNGSMYFIGYADGALTTSIFLQRFDRAGKYVEITVSTETTSASTGALVEDGGIASGENMYCGAHFYSYDVQTRAGIGSVQWNVNCATNNTTRWNIGLATTEGGGSTGVDGADFQWWCYKNDGSWNTSRTDYLP